MSEDAEELDKIAAVLHEYGYLEVAESYADCIRVVCQDKEKASELLSKVLTSSNPSNFVDKLECPCNDGVPDPCTLCGARADSGRCGLY